MLSEAVVKAGPVDLEAIDAGMDPHDLRLRHGRSPSYIAEPLLESGQRFDGVVDLRPGTLPPVVLAAGPLEARHARDSAGRPLSRTGG